MWGSLLSNRLYVASKDNSFIYPDDYLIPSDLLEIIWQKKLGEVFMIETNKNELFPITVSLIDEVLATLATGQTVTYDIRTIDDLVLSPPVSGSLNESSVEGGIYKTEVSIPTAGIYVCYATCSGFITSTEEIKVNEENIIDVSKYSLSYNTSVIDVPRTTASGAMTASQISRNVPLGRTDFITTLIKRATDLDWSNPVSSGTSYAHYKSISEELPFMIGGPF